MEENFVHLLQLMMFLHCQNDRSIDNAISFVPVQYRTFHVSLLFPKAISPSLDNTIIDCEED